MPCPVRLKGFRTCVELIQHDRVGFVLWHEYLEFQGARLGCKGALGVSLQMLQIFILFPGAVFTVPTIASLPMCSFPASTIRDIASQNPQVSISSDLVGSITKIALPQIKHGQMRIVPALVRGTTRSKRGHPSTATTTFRPTAAVQSQKPTSIDADDTVEDSIRRSDPGQPCCHPRSCLPGDGRACHQAARSRSQRR